MHVLVTGGLGFVGNAVTHVLHEAGHQVSVLTHSSKHATRLPAGVELLQADIRDVDALRRQLAGRGIEGVCHLAGLARVRDSFERPLDYYEVNVGGTINLLRALTEGNSVAPRIVFASTGAVYGSHVEGKLTEDLPAGAPNAQCGILPGTFGASHPRARRPRPRGSGAGLSEGPTLLSVSPVHRCVRAAGGPIGARR